ncbi:extracellular solute-binding protein [Acholeplasma sp. OttesenSCG-928-E16]|nr:extracellular solute-binding protein [Acholeplasma sp. OttesenSCG-928-E16]
MKKVFLLLMAIVAGFSIFACTPGDGRKTIVFWHTMGKTTDASQGGQALLNEFIKEFEELYPEYSEKYRIVHEAKGGYSDLNNAIGKAIPAGNEPHMAYCYPDHVAGYLRTNRVQKLNTLISDARIGLTAAEIADYVPAFWAEGSVYGDDSIYNLPFSKSTEVMFYNKTFFAKHNLTMPAEPTWDDILELSKKIKAIENSGITTPFGYDSEDNLYITASYQLGIPYTSVTLQGNTPKGEILFNSPEAKKMASYFYETFIKPGYMTTKELLGGYTSDKFRASELVMSVSSTGGTKYNVPTASDAGGVFEVGVVPAPRFGRNIIDETKSVKEAFIQQGPSITLFKKADIEVEIAWQFLKYITAPNQSARFSVPSGYSPVRISSYQEQVMLDLFADKSSKQSVLTAEVLDLTSHLSENFFTSPAFAKSAAARQAVGALLVNIFKGKDIDNEFKFAENSVVV